MMFMNFKQMIKKGKKSWQIIAKSLFWHMYVRHIQTQISPSERNSLCVSFLDSLHWFQIQNN